MSLEFTEVVKASVKYLRVLGIKVILKPMTLGEFNKDRNADRKDRLSKDKALRVGGHGEETATEMEQNQPVSSEEHGDHVALEAK